MPFSADLSAVPDTLRFPGFRFWITATADSLQVFLCGPVQTIPLPVQRKEGKWLIEAGELHGITEGPATLLVQGGNNRVSRQVWQCNQPTPSLYRAVYFTPKTINLDSAQEVHHMEHLVDNWRNLHPLDSGRSGYFDERFLALGTRAATYRGIADRPLSAYYVHAGSSNGIPLTFRFDDSSATVHLRAGPLKDSYNNRAANGTLVVFTLRRGTSIIQHETRILDTFATLTVPQSQAVGAELQVSIHRTHSAVLTIEKIGAPR